MKSDCLLGSLLLIKGVKLSGTINSTLIIHVLEPNGLHLTDVFDNFACMQLIELVCFIFMKHESYAAFRIRQDLALLILRGQLTKTMNLCLM
jgi:hypothetical protein